jgi:DNA-binding MarR family transcriptional regulator
LNPAPAGGQGQPALAYLLTKEGRRLFDKVGPAHEALVDRLLSALSREEQEQLHALLGKLDRALDKGIA